MRRKIEQYRNCKPAVIAKGSEAQIIFALVDADADVILLYETLTSVRNHLITITGYDPNSIMIQGIDEALTVRP